MKINIIKTGDLKENCYILDINNNILIIDPGDDFHKIRKAINKKKIIGILITHNHFDHVGALSYFKNIPVYSYSNLKEKEYNIEKFYFSVIYNPGHSSDSISFYFKKDKILFCGDFIFQDGIGRCDLPTGSEYEMKESINKIKKYPEEIIIYPGHGEITTLKHEIENNIYLR